MRRRCCPFGPSVARKSNRSAGPTAQTAIEKSCDTIFYKLAYDEWVRDGGLTPIHKPSDAFFKTAEQFGFGKKTGIDLPSEAAVRRLLAVTMSGLRPQPAR